MELEEHCIHKTQRHSLATREVTIDLKCSLKKIQGDILNVIK